MIRKYLFTLPVVIVLILIIFSSYANSVSQSNLSLSDKKIILETEKLQNEIFWSKYLPCINAGTLIIAIIGAVISFRTLNTQNRKNRTENLSNLLKELCSDNKSSRIEAVLALSEYKEAIPFMINSLRHESDKQVVELIIKVISKDPNRSIPLLVSESRNLKEKLRQLVCEYGLILYYENNNMFCDHEKTKVLKFDSSIAIGAAIKDEISQKFDINRNILDNWFSTNPDKINEKYKFNNIKRNIDRKLFVLKTQTGCFDNVNICNDTGCLIFMNEKERIIKEWTEELFFEISRIVDVIKNLIEHIPENRKKINLKGAFLQDIVFDGMDLSKFNFESADLWNASFKYTKCIQTNFKKIIAYNISFYDAFICGSDFSESELDMGDFRKSKAQGVCFRKCKGRKVNFKGLCSEWYKLNFIKGIKRIRIQNNEIDFSKTKLTECDFSNSELTNAIFVKANLFGSSFIRSKIQHTNFTNSNIDNVNFSDAITDCKATNIDKKPNINT